MATKAPDDFGVTIPNGSTGTVVDADEAEELSAIERLRSFASRVGSDKTRVSLHRITAGAKGVGAMPWCHDYSLEEFEAGDLNIIRDAWGPGSYELRLIGPKGIHGRVQIAIEAAPTKNAPSITAPTAAPQLSADIAQAVAAALGPVLQAISHQPDPMAQFAGMAKLMREMMPPPAPVAVPAPPQDQNIAMMNSLMMMKTVREFMKELKDDESDGDGKEPGLMGLASQMVDLIKHQMPTGAASVETPLPMLAPPPSIAHARIPAPTAPMQPTTKQQPSQEDMMKIVQQQLQPLFDMATRGAPANEGAEWIYENLPDDMVQFMSHPGWFEFLAQFSPDIRTHETWLREVKTLADGIFAEEASKAKGGK